MRMWEKRGGGPAGPREGQPTVSAARNQTFGIGKVGPRGDLRAPSLPVMSFVEPSAFKIVCMDNTNRN